MHASTMVALVVGGIYALLSAVHILWAFGVKWGGTSAVPEVGGAPAFVPGTLATVGVAAALAAAAYVVVARVGLAPALVCPWLVRVACFVLGAVFVLRAIGEFRLVGFFKSVKGTAFARWDSYLFSPLCLALGVAVLWLASVDRDR
jgi:hypothetical protein